MKVRSVLGRLSVEPALLLYYLAASIASMAETNLLLEKACSPDHPLPLGAECGFEEESQVRITIINSWRAVCEYTLPVAFILFGGAWSDAHGKRRKPLMVLPITGETLALFFVTGSVFFWKWSAEVTALFLALFRGMTGGRTCFSFGAITHIADTTSTEQRTFRMAVVTALIFISTPLGYALGGLLRTSFGFYATFNLCIVLNLMAIVLALWCVSSQSDKMASEKSCGFGDLLRTWKTLFRTRAGNKRTVLLLMVLVSPLFGGCLMGEYSVIYLYVRHKFHWGEAEGGMYLAFRMSVVFFGTLFSVGILSKVLRLSDAVIGLLATSFQVLAGLGNAFAQHPWQMFLYPLLDLMHGSVFAVGHSIVSKTVDPSEIGQVNSVLSTVDSLIPLVVFPLYNSVYRASIHEDPGAFFFISVAIAATCWAIFLTTVFLDKKGRTKVHTVIG